MHTNDDAPETMRSVASPITPRPRPIRVTLDAPKPPTPPQTYTAYLYTAQGLPC